MASKEQLQEIYNRGLQDQLPPERRAIFDEAVNRGLVVVEQTQDDPAKFTNQLVDSGQFSELYRGVPIAGVNNILSKLSGETKNKEGFSDEELAGGTPTDPGRIETIQRFANLEKIRLENPFLAGEIENMSESEQDLIGIGRFFSKVTEGAKRLMGVTTPEELEQLKVETDNFQKLTSVKPRVAFSEGLAQAPTAVAGGGVVAGIRGAVPRVATALGVGAAEGGLPSLGAGEDPATAAKKAAIGAAANVVGGEIFNIGKLSPKQAKIRQQLIDNPRDPKLAEFLLEGERPIKSAKLQEAIKQTGRTDLVAVAGKASPTDKLAIKKMVRDIQKLAKDPTLKGLLQPRNQVGDLLAKKVDALHKMNSRAGSNIDRIARGQLKGKSVDLKPARDAFKKSMNDLRVGYDPDAGVVTFSGSALEGANAGASRDLIKRLARDIKTPNLKATDAHFLKRMIDKQVTFGKSPSGIGGEIDQSIKDLRKGLNDSIRKVSKPYEQANTKYSDTIRAMDNLQSAAGSKVDLSSAEQLALSSRRISGNAQSGPKIIKSYKEIDDVLAKYGTTFKGDIRTQARVAEMLEERFKTQASNTFKSEVGKGVAENFAKSNTQVVVEQGGKLLDKARGVNDEQALKSLLEILK